MFVGPLILIAIALLLAVIDYCKDRPHRVCQMFGKKSRLASFWMVLAVFVPQASGIYSRAADQAAGTDDATVAEIKSLVEDAQLALFSKEYDEATTLLRKAIALNSHDAGANYDPIQFRRESPSAYGLSQVRQMLNDRPLMAAYTGEEDDLVNWAACRFSARINGGQMKWDASATDDPQCDSQMHVPHPGDPGFIRIRNLSEADTNKTAGFEWLWSHAVFELHNVDNAADFDALYEKARQNKITEDDFVKSMFLLELRAEQRTRKWYVEIYLPYAKKNKLRTQPMFWCFDSWGEPDSLFRNCTDKTKYPWLPYSSFYNGLRSKQ